ncbi:unnamed protein product [Peniophora sp. CBMAI 1063]|nr:unnamed protein product [Peniophora sp. CBMAI 1063]
MPATLDETLGAFYIGVVVGAALWGVSCLQTWIYYTSYPDDPVYMKLLVFVIWALDTLHQALVSHGVYIYLITNFANLAILNTVVWSVLAEVVVNALTAFIVQLFLTYRVYKLSQKNYWLTIPCVCLSLGQFIGFMVYSGKAYAGNFTTFEQVLTLKNLDISLNVVTAATDVAIAGTLTYLLHKSRTGFRKTDTIVKKLIIFVVNTGLLTSINALCSLITYSARPDTFLYICFFFVMGRLYSNSLLATLNARRGISEQSRNDSHSLQSIPMNAGRTANLSGFQPGAQSNVAVKVDTTLEYARDGDYAERAEEHKFQY